MLTRTLAVLVVSIRSPYPAFVPHRTMSPCATPRFAVRNQHPHDPVLILNGSAAPVSAMYRACPVDPANTAAVDDSPLIPTPNGTLPLLVRLRLNPEASDRSDRFHSPTGGDRRMLVKSAAVSCRPARTCPASPMSRTWAAWRMPPPPAPPPEVVSSSRSASALMSLGTSTVSSGIGYGRCSTGVEPDGGGITGPLGCCRRGRGRSGRS